MKIAVIGSGAIGSLVTGYLKLKGEEIYLVGRPDSVKAIRESGLRISGIRGDFRIPIDIYETVGINPELIILATKIQDIEEALKDNLNLIKNSIILTTQNGIRADYIVAKYIPKARIVSSILMFGSTYLEPGRIVHNFEGAWIIGRLFNKIDEELLWISEILNKIFPTVISEDIGGMKYLKIFVNANNCISAILGVSMQEAFSDLDICRISITIWKEGLDIINKTGINLVSLPDFPIERITRLTSLPSLEGAKVFCGIITNLSKEPLLGSILQSIKRGKPSEIDYINGEFVTLAKENNLSAPLNEKLVEMVHRVESTKRFFSKEELLSQTKGLFN